MGDKSKFRWLRHVASTELRVGTLLTNKSKWKILSKLALEVTAEITMSISYVFLSTIFVSKKATK